MSMPWLKMGRWVLIGAAAASGASACGGRGNLPFDEFDGEPDGGQQSFGGAGALAGRAGRGGNGASGSGAVGGSMSVAGTANVAGMPSVCVPGTAICRGDAVAVCTARGNGYKSKACVAGQHCVQKGTAASCQKTVCAPNQPACNGSVATVCNADGSGYLPRGIDCGVRPDLQCKEGVCACPTGLADCDGIARTGCESKPATDPDNCTGCGLTCSTNHIAKRTCKDGCNGTCATGFEDCNGDKLKDGCETSTAGDVKNCGGCGLACSNNHVAASCAGGMCNGECTSNFADCNGSKLKDGCESDSRIDVKNCGGCGLACSRNHVRAACAGGVCNGACAAGFEDCNNDKQADGCEINTLADVKNCGECGKACPVGEACVSGECSALLTFSGIEQDLPIASLVGWSQCYSEYYAQSGTSIASIQAACTGSLLMMACRPAGSDTLQLAAYAPRNDVLYDTGTGNVTHLANGVSWYFTGGESWGFAGSGDAVLRNSCDTQDSSIDSTGVNGDLRLCWHTGNSLLQGGWRCGKNDALNSSSAYERLLFQAQ